jgi:hypothetical protein
MSARDGEEPLTPVRRNGAIDPLRTVALFVSNRSHVLRKNPRMSPSTAQTEGWRARQTGTATLSTT